MNEIGKDHLQIPEDVKAEVLKESTRAIDTLRKIRTKILEGNESDRTRYLQLCTSFSQEVASYLTDYLLSKDTDALEKVKILIDTFEKSSGTQNTKPTYSYEGMGDLKHRQFASKFNDICKGLESDFIAAKWRYLSRKVNMMSLEPEDLAQDAVLIISPLSTGLLLISFWNEIFLRLNKISRPINIQTVATAIFSDDVYTQEQNGSFSQVVILDDTIPFPKNENGTVAKTHKKIQHVFPQANIRSAYNS